MKVFSPLVIKMNILSPENIKSKYPISNMNYLKRTSQGKSKSDFIYIVENRVFV